MSEPLVHLESQSNNAKRIWASSTRSASLVALGFVLAVTAILAANFLREKRLNPLTVGQIAALKAQLVQKPDDDATKEQIRQIDQHVRIAFFKGRELAKHGAYLLLGGVVVLLVALKLTGTLQAEPYLPDPAAVARNKQPWVAIMARRMIAGFALVLAGALVALAAMPRYRLPEFAVAKPNSPGAGPATTNPASPSPVASKQELPTAEQFTRNWPAFRGPTGTGAAPGGEYLTEWDGTSGKNILWKVPVPLPGNNSPVIWDRQLFLSGGTPEKREVYAFDIATGSLQWEQAAGGPTQVELMEDTGFAPSTMATDGRRLFAMFPTGDLMAFDFAGQRVWTKSLGMPKNAYGHASSLVTHKGRLIVQYDQGNSVKEANSALLAFDGLTGQPVWQTKREIPASWSSPIVATLEKGEQIITCGNPWVIAYDPASGKEIWRVKCLNGEVTPSPIYHGGTVYVCNDRAALVAIKTDGQGDVTKTHVLWQMEDNLPDIVSPLSTPELVFIVTTSGTLTCCDAKDGKVVWQQELDVEVKSSPSLVGNRIYLLDTQGVMHIFEAGRTFKEVAKCPLGEETYASPAFVGGRIYIRGKQNLYCIGPKS
ncbi:MAG: PQQ-binding-like beta-propeller repeat protein [Bacillota bacterium]